MSKIKPLVTENPEGNYQWLHNMTAIKDKEVFLRGYHFETGEDVSIVSYCRKKCKEKCDIDIDSGPEEFGEYMDCDCPISLLYHMAVGHAELRNRLGQYESIRKSPDEISVVAMSKVKMVKRNIYGKPEIKCHECGKIAQNAEKIIRLEMPYCGSCGKRIEDASQRYCGHCGERIDWDE